MSDLHDTTAAALEIPDDLRINSVSAGSILSESFRMLGQNFSSTIILSALVHLPTLLLIIATGGVNPAANGLRMLGDMVLGNLVAGAVTYSVVMRLSGQPVGALKALGKGLQRFFPVIAVGMVAQILIGLGFVALIVPGFIIMCALYVVIPAIVVERPGVFGALKRSSDLTSGYKTQIMGAAFVIGFVWVVLFFILSLVTGGMSSNGLTLGYQITQWMLTMLTGAWAAAAAAVTYHDLRVGKDGVQVDELVSVFD
jgi:hypothetical protein